MKPNTLTPLEIEILLAIYLDQEIENEHAPAQTQALRDFLSAGICEVVIASNRRCPYVFTPKGREYMTKNVLYIKAPEIPKQKKKVGARVPLWLNIYSNGTVRVFDKSHEAHFSGTNQGSNKVDCLRIIGIREEF